MANYPASQSPGSTVSAHLARLVALLSVVLVACLPPSGSAISSDEPEPGRLELFAVDPFEKPIGYSLVRGNAKQQVEARFGKPQALQTWQADDRTSAAKLNFYRFTYPGLVFVVGEGEDRARSWIESIELSDGHPALKFGLGIGVSADTVATTFAPASTSRSVSAPVPGPTSRTVSPGLSLAAYEDRNDTSVESYVELTFTLDDSGVVQKILIETISL